MSACQIRVYLHPHEGVARVSDVRSRCQALGPLRRMPRFETRRSPRCGKALPDGVAALAGGHPTTSGGPACGRGTSGRSSLAAKCVRTTAQCLKPYSKVVLDGGVRFGAFVSLWRCCGQPHKRLPWLPTSVVWPRWVGVTVTALSPISPARGVPGGTMRVCVADLHLALSRGQKNAMRHMVHHSVGGAHAEA